MTGSTVTAVSRLRKSSTVLSKRVTAHFCGSVYSPLVVGYLYSCGWVFSMMQSRKCGRKDYPFLEGQKVCNVAENEICSVQCGLLKLSNYQIR